MQTRAIQAAENTLARAPSTVTWTIFPGLSASELGASGRSAKQRVLPTSSTNFHALPRKIFSRIVASRLPCAGDVASSRCSGRVATTTAAPSGSAGSSSRSKTGPASSATPEPLRRLPGHRLQSPRKVATKRLAGRRYSTCGAPACATSPRSSTMMRSERKRASS